MRSLSNSLKAQKKTPPAKKQWTAARSRPSATSAKKTSPKAPGRRPAILAKAAVVKNSKTKKLSTAKRPPLNVDQGLALLKEHYGNAECALVHRNPFELVIATILSAQCTDERVNMVTPNLFARFPTPEQMAKASLEELEELIRSTGFYKNKAKSLKNCATNLVANYNSEVPRSLEELIELPGVGRKTANVVLGVAYQIATGVVVDTHVTRLSARFRWSNAPTAEKIEQDLMKIIPQSDWIACSHLLIHHGRKLCKARTPLCKSCFLFDRCPRYGVK